MSYTEDIGYAARNLIELATHEETELECLRSQLETERARFETYRWDYETSDLNDDFSDIYVQAAFHRMASAHTTTQQLEVEVAAIEAAIGAREAAVQALCGAILQIAKQGISLVYGSPSNAPDGRLVSGIPLKEIVWQARNQAIHFEDSSFHTSVISLFSRLESQFGDSFSLTRNQNKSLAKQTINLLGWGDYLLFKQDMRSLGL